MYIFEIFKKRRDFEPIFKSLWSRISPELVYPPVAAEDQHQKLIYVGLLAYAAVFTSATAARMSSSAAHYLARTQMRQYKFDKQTGKAVEKLFSGTECAEEQAYAQLLLERMGQIAGNEQADGAEVALIMQEVASAYQPLEDQQ
ncbi:MAG: hypothetical protein RQ754_15580 [Desulfuromonadales bacterium]|nr:hypothetical protein [Desulfuromonadales bacterium]